MSNKPTKAQVKKERSQTKLKKVLKQKGYKDGKLLEGKVAHHPRKVSEGGKTTKKNIMIVTESKHRKIHSKKK